MGAEMVNLQNFLSQANVIGQDQDPVECELVVIPNYIPDERKRLSHGSRARELVNEVFETMRLTNDWGFDSLTIKPDGAMDSWSEGPKPFVVPLKVVTGITLHREQKPLSPYLEGPRTNLKVIPVTYK